MNEQLNLIDARFEAIARMHGDRVALVGQRQELTYRQLSSLSDRFAQVLTALGVGVNTPVAICLGRSPEAIVAMLGILKTGACYVPIDPAYPADAQHAYLNKVGARFVVVSDCGQQAGAGTVAVPISLEALAALAGHTQPLRRPMQDERSASAYVMFTSGSTGDPKGVLGPHSGVLRLVVDTNYIALTEHDVLLQLSPITFDASTFEIWGALLNGGCLVVYEPTVFDINEVTELVDRQGVTVLWLTAALFHLVVRRAPRMFGRLRTLLAGGDVLHPPAVRAVFESYPDLVVVNGYGPTENTTFTCCYVMTAATPIGDVIPIGHPVTGTRVHVLDENRLPVQPGDTGELYAGGLGVGLGYVNAEAQSRRVFISDLLVPGERLYKTGDLVRQLPDGSYDFIGRLDNQVKIRGYRVSVEEVQQAINNVRGVEESVVQVQDDASGGRRLAAFVQTNLEPAAFRTFLRNELASKLPPFMVPDLIDIQHALPVNRNGKVDRSSLVSATVPG